MSGHSVDFSGNNVFYQFLNLDVSGTIAIDASYMDLFFVPGISGYDAVATLNVPVDKFSRLFWVNMRFQDLRDGKFSDLKYAVDSAGWNNGDAVAFSNAVVASTNAVNPSLPATRQQIKQDFVRFLLKEITGSINMNSLFRNKTSLVNSTAAADTSFQSSISSLLSTTGGTFASPKDGTTLNPGYILMNSILGEDDDGVDNFNDARKGIVLNYFRDKLETMYTSAKANKYYAYGLGEQGLGWYYPLYIDASHVDLTSGSGGYHTHTFSGSSYLISTGVTYRTAEQTEYGATISVQHATGGVNVLRYDYNNPNRANYRMMCRVDLSDNQIGFNTIVGEPGYSDADMSGATGWYAGAFDFSGYYHNHFAGQPMQAESMNEFGMALGLTGKAGQKLKSVKLAFDVWYTARYSSWSADARYTGRTSGFDVPVTLTFYTMHEDGEVSNKLGTSTTTLTMDWCPESRGPAPTGDGYNGWAFKRTVDVSSLNMLVPANETVVLTVAYSTQTYGPSPLGVDGPYNALNIGMMEASESGVTYGTSAGSLPKDNAFYVNSANALFYADQGKNTALKVIRVDTTIYVVGGTDGNGTLVSYGQAVAGAVMAKASDLVVATGTTTTIIAFPLTPLANASMTNVGMTFYMPNTSANHAVNPKPSFDSTYTDYATVDSSFIPFPFVYGDTLAVKLTYYPKTSTIAGRPVGHRSYLVNLNMGVESVTRVPFVTNPPGGSGTVIVGYDSTLGMNFMQQTTSNKAFAYLVWNGQTTPTANPFVSPTNFYPTLADISGMQMKTYLTTNDQQYGRNWFFGIYTRPRTGGGASWYGTRLTGIVPMSPPNVWTHYTMADTHYLNNFDEWGNWDNVLNRPLGVSTTYGYCDTYSQEQILGIAISTDSSCLQFAGKIADVIVTFKDGRILKFV